MAVPGYIYGLRGWIAFVAFMEIGMAMRCFVDNDFLKLRLYVNSNLNDYTLMNRQLGMWSILNATILLHCALCIHHFSIFVLTICTLILSIMMYIMEAFIYESMCKHSLSILVPVCIKGVTIILLSAAPPFLWIPGKDFDESDEEENLIKSLPNKKRWNKKRNDYSSLYPLLNKKINIPAIEN